jgi:membrane-associated phospholipid phosphatase
MKPATQRILIATTGRSGGPCRGARDASPLLIASSVGVERVASGHHFPTDVAVAAVVGTGIGIGVPWLHLRRWDTHVQIAPVGAHGLGLTGTF